MRVTVWSKGTSRKVVPIRHRRSEDAYLFTQHDTARQLRELGRGKVEGKAGSFQRPRPMGMHTKSKASGHVLTNYTKLL